MIHLQSVASQLAVCARVLCADVESVTSLFAQLCEKQPTPEPEPQSGELPHVPEQSVCIARSLQHCMQTKRNCLKSATLSQVKMDESSLLDLLECSVCLERLDTTAKVLPCQHTFCRRCLENIVSSRNELRCPECRILVDCGVDDLPANILLVRLLDGIKQRPRNGGRPSLTGISLGCAAGISASPPGTAIRDLPIATRSSPVKVCEDVFRLPNIIGSSK